MNNDGNELQIYAFVRLTNILKNSFFPYCYMNEYRDKKRLVAVGKKIRSIRESHGLSQDDVVKAYDVIKGNLSMIENGNKDFFITTCLR